MLPQQVPLSAPEKWARQMKHLTSGTEGLYNCKISSIKTGWFKECKELKYHNVACLSPSCLQQDQWGQRRGASFGHSESEPMAGLGHQTPTAMWSNHIGKKKNQANIERHIQKISVWKLYLKVPCWSGGSGTMEGPTQSEEEESPSEGTYSEHGGKLFLFQEITHLICEKFLRVFFIHHKNV